MSYLSFSFTVLNSYLLGSCLTSFFPSFFRLDSSYETKDSFLSNSKNFSNLPLLKECFKGILLLSTLTSSSAYLLFASTSDSLSWPNYVNTLRAVTTVLREKLNLDSSL